MPFPCALLAAVLVDLLAVDPALRFDIRYATARNFLGRPVYPAARAFLRPDVAKALQGANAFLEGQGLGLRIAELTDALLFVELEGKGDKFHVGFWFSVYDEAQAKALEAPAKRALRRIHESLPQ